MNEPLLPVFYPSSFQLLELGQKAEHQALPNRFKTCRQIDAISSWPGVFDET